METILTQITDYLLTQSWQIAVLAVVIAAVSFVMKNSSAHIRYLLWLVVLAKCLVPGLYRVPLAILPRQEMPEPVVSTAAEMPAFSVEPVDIRPTIPVLLPPAPVVKPHEPTITERLAEVSIRQWLGYAWIVGAVVFVLAAIVKALRTNRWLRRERKPLPADLEAGVEDFFAGLGVKSLPKVWLVDGIGQPFVWGLWRGSIYLPANFGRVNGEKDRRGVLGHELSHVVRYDALVNLLQIIAQAVYWFHPFVWWANRKIREEREKCCDEMAIARLNTRPKDYSTAIVNTLIAEHKAKQPVPSLAVAGPVRNIEDRIKTIMRSGKKFYRRPTFITIVTVLLLAAVAVPTTLALTRRLAREQANIEQALLDGFRHNTSRFECGRLVWNSTRTGYHPALEGDTELRGTFELWWDGKKIATSYAKDTVNKGPDGRVWIEKREGGNSYDAGIFSRSPKFRNEENWFEIIRWTGPMCVDKEIPALKTMDHIVLDLSTVVVDGRQLIKLVAKNMGQTTSDYGGYSVRYFDSSKGCGLVNEEWYNADDTLRMKHTVALREVIPGGWFPCQVHFKSFSPKDGKVISHRHLALDIERSSFNDKSAIPDGIFESSKVERRQEQEKLDMVLETFSEVEKVDESDESDRHKRRALEVVELYLGFLKDGEYDSAVVFADPNSAVGEQTREFEEFRKQQDVQAMTIAACYADDEKALAVSTVIRADHGRVGPLVFHLVNENGKWLVNDIDMETAESAEQEVQRFLENHAEAKVTAAQPEQQGWGEAVEGLQVRLCADRLVWRQDEIPAFKIDLRHMDTDKGLQWAGYREKLEIEVNGRWYRSRVETSSPPFQLTAARPVSEADVDLEYYHRGHAVWTNEEGYALDLGPGRHVVRTRMTVLYGRPIDSDVEKVTLVSNPVEIEIAALPERVVRFPKDRSVGVLQVQPWRWELNSDNILWEELGQAKGDVVVPAGKQLWLQISAAAADDLSFLESLRPDDIHMLGLYGDVTQKQLEQTAALASLRELYFHEGRITDEQLAHLRPLKGLWTLNLFGKDITDAGLVRLEDMKSLKFLYLGRTQVTVQGIQRLRKALPECVIIHDFSDLKAGAGDWGEPVEGISVRLRTTGMLVAEGQTPILKIDLRSEQARTLPSGIAQVPDDFEICVDGKWYYFKGTDIRSYIDPTVVKGREGIHLRLFAGWQAKSDGTPMNLAAGRHTVQAAFIVRSDTSGSQSRLRVLSNPVEIEILAAREPAAKDRLGSAEKLSRLGKALLVCANDDDRGAYPDNLVRLQEGDYIGKKALAWHLENVQYVGKGKTAADPPDAVLAFDKVLLQEGKGTNVLFNDSHVAFEGPERLKRLRIVAESELPAEARQRLNEKMVTRDPNNLEAWVELGRAQMELGRYSAARETFEMCLKLNPKYVPALEGLGMALEKMGRVDEAVGYYRKAVDAWMDAVHDSRAPPRYTPAKALAEISEELGEYGRADRLRKVLQDAESVGWGKADNGLAVRLIVPTEAGEPVPRLTSDDFAAVLEVKNVSDRVIKLAEQNPNWALRITAPDWLVGLYIVAQTPDRGALWFFRADDQGYHWSRIGNWPSVRDIELGEVASFGIRLRRLVNREGTNLLSLRGRWELQPVLKIKDAKPGLWHGQAVGKFVPVVILPDEETAVKDHLGSLEKLSRLGKALLVCANDDDRGAYPDNLMRLQEGDYIGKKDLAWHLENVQYLGKGKTAADPPDAVLAFDRVLLQEGKGTNVLFNDSHVAFEGPERLRRLGVVGGSERHRRGLLEGDSSFNRFRDRTLVSVLLKTEFQDKIRVSDAEVAAKMESHPALNYETARAVLEDVKLQQLEDEFYEQICKQRNLKKLRHNFLEVVQARQRLLDHPEKPRRGYWIKNRQIEEELTQREKDTVLATYEGGQLTLEDWFSSLNDMPPPRRPTDLDTVEGVERLLDEVLRTAILVVEAQARGLDRDDDFLKQISERTEQPTEQEQAIVTERESQNMVPYRTGAAGLSAAVYKQLDRIVDLSGWGPEMPFSEALEVLKASVKPPLNIVVLWRDLQENAGVDRTTPINMDPIRAIRVGTALEILLRSVAPSDVELGYVVKDGVIVIATKDSLPKTLETRVYDIYGLVHPPGGYGGHRADSEIHQIIEESLPESSKPVIQVESRFVMVSDNFLEDMGFDGNSLCDIRVRRHAARYSSTEASRPFGIELGPEDANARVSESVNSAISQGYSCILDDLQVHLLLRAVQAHRDSKVLAAPKVMVLDGESATLSIETNVNYISGYLDSNLPSHEPKPKHELVFIGTKLQVLPKLISDSNNILLDVDFEISDLIGFQEHTYKGKYVYQIPQMEVVGTSTRASIPDGGTVLIGGKKVKAENEDGQRVEKNLLVLIRAVKARTEDSDTAAPGLLADQEAS